MSVLIVITLIVIFVGILGHWAYRNHDSAEPMLSEPQSRPVLGGSVPDTHAWQRYHVRYYTMMLLFVAFEMEMIFMYPWAVVYVEEGIKALAEMGMFLAILSVGVFYGWREGIFQWE